MSSLPPGPGTPESPLARPWPYDAPPPPGYPSSPYDYAPPPYRYASFGKRVGAYLIDGGLIAVLAVPGVLVLATGPEQTVQCDENPFRELDGQELCTELTDSAFLTGLLLLALAIVVAVGYRVVTEGGPSGQTLGKRAVGIRVVQESGLPLGYGRALGRILLQFAAWGVSCAWLVDYLFPIWDEKKQTLHDKIIKSVVIEAN